jgi:hypothetical protein
MKRLVRTGSLLLLAMTIVSCSNARPNAKDAANKNSGAVAPTAATPSATPDEPGRFYLADRRLSIMPPAGFVPMPATEIAEKYPGSPPLQVFTNSDRTATIAITHTQQPLGLNQLPELKLLMSKRMEKTVPGLKWIRKDLISINGGSWMNMEATSNDGKVNLHNDMYFTSFQDRLLGINFSASAKQFAGLKAAFNQSRDSVQGPN